MGRLKYPELRSMYKIDRKIGEGGFAKVRLATHILTGEKVAIKIMEKASLGRDLRRVLSEVEALKSLTHHHISQVYEVINTDDTIFIIMEYCSGGELFDYIVNNKRLSESEARGFFRQILSAVAYLHKRGYAHRDLKPENILLDSDHNLKLIDFGLCAKPTGGISMCLKTACGSLNYAAPELLLGVRYLGSVADVWSLGVLLYALLCGALPFDESGGMPGELQKKIINGQYEEPEHLSQLSRELLRGMLQTDPRHRLTTEQLLGHKWVTLDCYDPVCYLPIYKHHERDDQVLHVLGDYYSISAEATWQRLSRWTYDYFTASYLLLLNKKRRGLQYALSPQCMAIKARAKLRERPQNVMGRSDVYSAIQSPLSPSHLSYTKMIENIQEKSENIDFDSPSAATRSRARKRGYDSGSDGFASSVPTTPVHKRRRVSDFGSENRTPGNTPTSTPGKFFHSVERKLNKMRSILTPKKKSDDGPAVFNAKDLHDVSVTSMDDPKQVLESLTAALSSANLPSIVCKSRGYVLRGKVFDNHVTDKKPSNCKLAFELEVCWVKSGNRSPVVGIKRKRLQGDTFYYKKICEQVLQLTVK